MIDPRAMAIFTAGHDIRLETARLTLRPFEDRDFDSALPFYRDPEFVLKMEGTPPEEVTREYLLEAAEAMSAQGYYFAIDERSSGRTIGEVCLQWMNLERGKHGDDEVMRMPIGIWDRFLWRRGYGKEVAVCLMRYAFETLRIDRLCAMDVDSNNAYSRGLWESLGFRIARELDGGSMLDYEISAATWREQQR